MTPRGPLWLREPSRFAGIAPWPARILMAAIVLLMLLSFQALLLADPSAAPVAASAGDGDLVLYEGIVAALRGGGEYYTVTADALRAGGYPLRPFVTFRLPTLAVVQASVPPLIVSTAMIALALGTGLAWLHRLRRDALATGPALLLAAVLLVSGMIAFVQVGLFAFHEFWAAPLVALSLALRRPGAWVSAVAIGLAATLIRETAMLYLAIMAVLAWFEGERREAFGWAGAIAGFLVVLGFHAWAVGHVTGPLDPRSPGWAGLHGFGLFVRSVTLATALQAVPLFIAAPLVALSLAGWLGWRDAAGIRVAAMLAGYALVIGVFGRTDTFYWGVMAAPLLLTGLVFVPDMLRDLSVAALDRRRVRVHRITR